MTTPEPCRLCGSEVRMVAGPTPKRNAGQARTREIRRCTNTDCRSNRPAHQRRMTELP